MHMDCISVKSGRKSINLILIRSYHCFSYQFESLLCPYLFHITDDRCVAHVLYTVLTFSDFAQGSHGACGR